MIGQALWAFWEACEGEEDTGKRVGCSIAFRFFAEAGAGGDGDLVGGVGFSGGEGGVGGAEFFGEVGDFVADTLDDAAGELVGAVVAVVGVVFEGVILIREGVGRIMDEGIFGAFFSEGLIEFQAHGVKVNDGDFLFLAHLADGGGEVGEGLLGVAVFPAAAFHGRDEDGVGFLFAGGGEVAFEVFFVAGEGAGTVAFVLLVVVAELDEEVVAGLDGGEDFFEPSFSAEAVEGAAGFGVVGDGDAGLEEGGKHLAPSGPGGFGLVGDGGISGEIDGG